MKFNLNGFYKGNKEGNWLGKTFSAKTSSGINNFRQGSKEITKYPFKTYEENNLLKLDYNLPVNPWWLRLIIDDLKETNPNHFEGTMKIKILELQIPLAKFTLTK